MESAGTSGAERAPARAGLDGGAPRTPAGPSALVRLVVAPLRAGLLGCGVFLWALGLGLALRQERLLFRPSEGLVLAFAFFLAAAAALGRGYLTPLRSYPALVGRFLGALLGGGLALCSLLLVSVPLAEKLDFHQHNAGAVVEGMVVTALAVAWLYGRRIAAAARASSPRARYAAAAVAAAVALVSAWPLSARLRCGLGSGQGCYLAASRAMNENESAAALALAERGCSLDDSASCRFVGDAVGQGSGAGSFAIPPDPARAEAFYRAACALGDALGCRDLGIVELQGGCARQRASACRELADAVRSGSAHDVNASARYLRQACLLGDAEACRGAR